MAGRFVISREFSVLFLSEAVILLAVPYIDWVIVNEVILKSSPVFLPSAVASYAKAFEAIKWAVIIPTIAMVWLLKRDVISTAVWTVSAYLPLATGTEDLVYYAIGWRALPPKWPWLDNAPGIAWTRTITGTSDVVTSGVVIATCVGWILLVGIWLIAKKKGPLGSLSVSS